MFNVELKNEALKIHDNASTEYENTYSAMEKECENLHSLRCESVQIIDFAQNIINSIANSPKEFDKTMSNVNIEITKFKSTEEYANESYNSALRNGVSMLSGASLGAGVATMAPTALMGIATTFGTATTGTAIRTLTGVAAKKAATAWIGRTFAGFAVKEGAGLIAGETLLALAGPIGWGLTAVTVVTSCISFENDNKKLADEAFKEAKEIAAATEKLKENIKAIKIMANKTLVLLMDMIANKKKMVSYYYSDFRYLTAEEKLYLATLVNSTKIMSEMLNKNIK